MVLQVKKFAYIYFMKKANLKTLIINKKILFITMVCLVVIMSFTIFPTLKNTASPKAIYTVVIDAGHGGIDGGSVGKTTKVLEANLNLEYARCLQKLLCDFGFNVVMTRNSESGLYSPLATNKKKDDMKKRKQIVENSNADFVISIHMNSYTSSSIGAQVFYGEGDEPSKNLAQNIQNYFIKNLQNARQEIKVGDYFMLNAIKSPSVLVECGFLSNPKEEALLITDEYKKEVCYNILLGILTYLE